MTINKNFVVRNGLEVAQTLLCADDETNRVGINSANPKFELDLYGDLRINGGLSVGGTTGRPGEYLESTGDALEWKAIPVLRVVETYTAVSGQVTFPATGFLPYAGADFIDVFVDGVKLSQDEYTSNPGNTRIELVAPAFADETVELVAYNASSIGVGGSGIQGITVGEEGVVVGTAGQVTTLNFVGASLTAIGSGAGVTVYFDNVVPGIATYASFSGIATYASTSRVTIKDSGSTIGIAGTIDFGDNLTVSALSAGIVTITAAASGGTSSQWVTTSTGIHTTSNVGVGTTNATSALTVKGNTSLETLNVSGISTFAGIITSTKTGDNGATFNSTAGQAYVVLNSDTNFTSFLDFKENGTLKGNIAYSPTGSGALEINSASNRNVVIATGGGNVGVATTNATSKLTVSGNVLVSGIVTATSFSGSNTLKVRSTVSGTTTSIANTGIGNTDITGFKSYALMKVGLSTAGWLRLYTDNASRAADASRSVGIDPAPGSGVIAEVITTGISTTQIISPFVMGGNLDDPSSTTIYAAITNLSGITTSISVNLTLLQLEA